jgi:hypothetical protein
MTRPSNFRRAVLVAAVFSVACQEAARAPVVVRNPDYLVVRTIRREADAEHTMPVDLPEAGGGSGFASTRPLLDMSSFDLGAASFLGGRTSIVGEATIWLPLKPDDSRRLEEWSSKHPGEPLGIFLKGKLVAAPQVRGAIGGGIPLRVASKSEGDQVLEELRAGGAPD